MKGNTISLERPMGKRKVVDKTVRPMTTLTNLTPAMVTAGTNVGNLGVLPLGYYKGGVAFLDLDLAVNQPNVLAEQQHILGILDGREEDYDLQTLAIAIGDAAGLAHVADLTVPTGEVWYINNVITTTPANATANWYCSLWTDRLGSLGYGQAFHAAAIAAGLAQWDEFQMTGGLWLATNKSVALRAPAGTVFTVVATNPAIAVAATNCTFQLYGWIGKTLVA